MKVATFFRTVVAIMGSLTHVGAVCTGGIVGVESTSHEVCCVEECGMCGGPECSHSGNSTLTANDCCVTEIMESDVLCDVSGVAPCILTASADTNSTCSNGLAGIEDSGVCCDSACGLCGGEGCGSVPGLSGDDCCTTTIASNGTLCSVAGEAPCIIDPPEVISSTCPNGLAGVQDDSVCCAEACNLVCGGTGCGRISGTEGASDCCSGTILAAGVFCEDGVVAPCIMVDGTYTSAPSMTPTSSPTITPPELFFTSSPTIESEARSLELTFSPTHTPTTAPLQPGGDPIAAPTAPEPTIASLGSFFTTSPSTSPISAVTVNRTVGDTIDGTVSPAPADIVSDHVDGIVSETATPTPANTVGPTLSTVDETTNPSPGDNVNDDVDGIVNETATPTPVNTVGPTLSTIDDTASGAATVSTGNLVALTALVTGTFAMFAAARN